LAKGAGLADMPGINAGIEGRVMLANEWAYAHAYRPAWASIVPFVALALVAVVCLKGVKELMTEKVETTVEHVDVQKTRDVMPACRIEGVGWETSKAVVTVVVNGIWTAWSRQMML
jgi:hypothetical protein